MKRFDLKELHYITPIDNVTSIFTNGVLCNKGAARLKHKSVALESVQDRRRNKAVPGGKHLHDYVNLYFHARNPMMYRRKEDHVELCVIAIDTAVLDLAGVVVTDMNAAKDIARFYPADKGLANIDYELVFAEDWRHHGNPVEYERHKGIKCAEVLVPACILTKCIKRIYVSGEQSLAVVKKIVTGVPVVVNAHLFFQ